METTSSVAGLLISGATKPEICYPARSAVLSPLSFGRVNDGRPVTSRTLLFRLPIELVQEVAAYLDTTDLRSLALADQDCRQLARSRLFASVVFDRGGGKRALLDKLSRHEARGRQDNGCATERPSIGACIRRVTVAMRPIDMSCPHWILSPTNDSISKEEEFGAHNSVCNYCEIYLPDIAEALRFSLPNLDELIWADIILPQYMLTAIASSPIRHLGLQRVQLPLDCEYQLPPPEQQRWALQSLDLGVVLYPRDEWRGRNASKFFLTILKAAAPTLEKLSWRDCQGTKLSFGNSAIRFPRLRTLSLTTRCMPDDTALDAFFPTDAENCVLCALSINVPGSLRRESLAQRLRIRGLESLRLYTLEENFLDSTATDATLLSANPQLKSLTLVARTPEKLATTLLPLLASEFKFLTTLVVQLTSPWVDLPSGFLAATGRLISLTSLWIVAGRRHDWTANVPLTIAALSPLRNLARLGLSRQHTTVISLVRESEDRYKERMRNIVRLYVEAFRELKWVYFGLLVHRVVGGAVVPGEGDLKRYSPAGLWESPDW